MPDKEKVIKGLECCNDAVSKCGKNCPYWIIENCQSNMQADALALLKAQEPVEPKQYEGTSYCGNCGDPINKLDNYCHECGRAVKWE